jgi:hypothetical protein
MTMKLSRKRRMILFLSLGCFSDRSAAATGG